MSDDRRLTPGCLGAETLAAFIDGRLSSADRASVEHHLAECEDCYEVWMEAAAVAPSAGATHSSPWRPNRLLSLAGAAVILLSTTSAWYWWSPGPRADRAVQTLAASLQDQRLTVGRVTAFEWAAQRGDMRGGSHDLSLETRAAIVNIERLARDRTHARTLHAAGLAALVSNDLETAAATLIRALELAGEDGSAALLTDLSAVYLERWRRNGAAADAAEALNASERALAVAPAHAPALFNKALALTALSFRDRARLAWTTYLDVDSDSPWATEARSYLADLSAADAGPRADVFDTVERTAIRNWAVNGTPLGSAVVTAAVDLRTSGGDRWLSDITTAIATSTPGFRADCLRNAVRALSDWREAFEAGGYTHAQRLSIAAAEQLACAGLSDVRPRLQRALLDLSLGQTGAADTIARQLHPVAERRGYWRDVALASQILGSIALQDTRFSEAVTYQRASWEAARRSRDPEAIVVAGANLATALANSGDRRGAWDTVARSATYLDMVSSDRRQHQVYARAIALAEQQGLWGTALELSRAVLAFGEARSVGWALVSGHLQSARAYLGLGQSQLATGALEHARRHAEAIVDPEFRQEALAEVALTRGRVLMSTDPTGAAQAFEDGRRFLEARGNRTRTTSLLLQIGRARLAAGDTESAQAAWLQGVEMLEDQRPAIRDEQLRLSRTSDTWDIFDELILHSRPSPVAALSYLERAHARELLDALPVTQSATSVPQVMTTDWMPASWTALAFLAARDRLLVWTIRADHVTLTEHPVGASALTSLVTRHRTAIREHRVDDSGLGALLLPTTLALDPASALIVIPDGVLNDVAFAALPTTDGRPLVTRTHLVQSPGLGVLRRLAEHPARPVGTTVIVDAGSAGDAEGLPRLPWASQEAATVSHLYPQAVRIGGRTADPPTVTRALNGAALVSFSGHAVADTVRPSESFLLVHPGGTGSGRIPPASIATTTLAPGALVVLGACSTARGQVFRGEGSLSMARPFLIAGASSVVAALWDVPDRNSYDILSRFHTRVANGDSPSVALAAAQRHAQSTGVPPASWAGFTVIGRP